MLSFVPPISVKLISMFSIFKILERFSVKIILPPSCTSLTSRAYDFLSPCCWLAKYCSNFLQILLSSRYRLLVVPYLCSLLCSMMVFGYSIMNSVSLTFQIRVSICRFCWIHFVVKCPWSLWKWQYLERSVLFTSLLNGSGWVSRFWFSICFKIQSLDVLRRV